MRAPRRAQKAVIGKKCKNGNKEENVYRALKKIIPLFLFIQHKTLSLAVLPQGPSGRIPFLKDYQNELMR